LHNTSPGLCRDGRCATPHHQGLADTRLSEWPKSRTLTTPNNGEDVSKGTLVHSWQECKIDQPLWKAVFLILIKPNTLLLYNPTIQQLHALVFSQRNWKLMSTQKPAQKCLWWFYSSLPKLGNNQNVLQ
jgi:hypothetical protein